MNYDEFVAAKIPRAEVQGFEPLSLAHPGLKPHQADIARWAVQGGRRAIFKSFGLGKTRTHLQVAIWIVERERSLGSARKHLIIAPLGVRYEFTKEQGPAMGLTIDYVRDDAEVAASAADIVITNYERVRDGGITITPETFCSVGLDEASVLRSFGSKTYQTFNPLFKSIPYRFVFTATPSPNRQKELIHYSAFLGIMDSGDALTRFFKRNSEKAGDLTLYPHMEEFFWNWLASWAVFMQRPSNLGYSDEGYDLPPGPDGPSSPNVHWHRIPVDNTKAWKQFDSWGQSQLLVDQSNGLAELAEVKRETMIARVAFAKELIDADPDRHYIVWHDLEDERRMLEKAIPGIRTAYGSQDLEEREETIRGFANGEIAILGTKPSIAGSGTNLQRHCADAIFIGSSYKFNDFIQAVHRIYRFQQSRPVNIRVIFSEAEDDVINVLKSKWAQHNELVARMTAIIEKHHLSLAPCDLTRARDVVRQEKSGRWFRAIQNDCVRETSAMPENSVGLIVTSIPFGNQYEYSPSLLDFGHNPDNQGFFRQMEFLVSNLLRVMQPGRIAAIHVKDRIRFGAVTGTGAPTVDRFSDKTADLFERAGFLFMGRITIDTDVVRENAQTYRLGWSENAKDSTKMGVGMPEYVLIFRKPQSDLTKGYADAPVLKDKQDYTRAHWQVDADSFWRSSGITLPDRQRLKAMPVTDAGKLWRRFTAANRYCHRQHVELARTFEETGSLPSGFMLFPTVSRNPMIWTDITRMRVLNAQLDARNRENHVCPLQIDIVERLIGRYSNEGDIIFDPFAGVFTVPSVAVRMKRVGWGTELAENYWRNGVDFCEEAERKRAVPEMDLFAGLAPSEVKEAA